MPKNRQGTRVLASLSCLFAALCSAGAYISLPIPVSPVPLALTNLFVVLGGLLLGPAWGALSSIAYVALGALGLPVFSNGRGGIAYLAGPTGGYLAGYIAGAALSGLLAAKGGRKGIVLGSAVGFFSILALGSCDLAMIQGLGWSRAIAVGILPFLPGDTLKTILAALVAKRLRPFIESLSGEAIESR
jgi:biotin transport system substrate-specific component